MTRGFSCLKLKQLPIAVLIFISPLGSAATLAECQKAQKDSVSTCDKRQLDARKASDARSAAALANCQKAGKSGPVCARELSATGLFTSGEYDRAIAACEDDKKSCTQACQPAATDTPVDRTGKENAKKKCSDEIAKGQGNMQRAKAGSGSATEGGNANAEASSAKSGEQAQSQSSGMPPIPQMPQAAQPAAETPKSEPTPPAPVADTSKDPATATDADSTPEAKPEAEKVAAEFQAASVNYCARAGKNICPGCSGFQNQCSIDAATCLRQMSSDQVNKIRSTCADGPGNVNQAITEALNNAEAAAGFQPASTASATGSASGAGGGASGGGGGGGGGLGGSANPGVGASEEQISDYMKKMNAEGDAGNREGSLRVDSSGGYSSNPSDGSSASGDDAPYGMPAKSGDGGRAIASYEEQSLTGHVTDVQGNRFGPSVFSISSEVLKARCAKGLFLHCRPGKK